MSAQILLGTQGWNHPGWVGPFYPHGTQATEMLGFYSRAFPTVELDSTFYAIPAEPIVAAWREQTPSGFVFALKVPQEITHEKRFLDVEQRLARFLNRVSGLEDRLGPLLIQLSPDFRSTESNRQLLSSFLESLSSEFRWAVEFRQPQWLSPEMTDLMRRRNVALVLADGRWIKRGVMLDLAIEPTANFGYVRWSGQSRTGGAATGDEGRIVPDRSREIGVWVEAVKVMAERVGTIHGYCGNHFQGHAPTSARQFQKQLGITPVEPMMLREQAELF
jgi:uncharacterized protein YecE (DUF72 family)